MTYYARNIPPGAYQGRARNTARRGEVVTVEVDRSDIDTMEVEAAESILAGSRVMVFKGPEAPTPAKKVAK